MTIKIERVCSALLALVLCGAANAAVLTGTVTSGGRPAEAALVTLFDDQRLVSETVVSDAAGRYRLTTQLTGTLRLRARAEAFEGCAGHFGQPACERALHAGADAGS